ncbi:MAG: bifunctional 4-hydroxy-2-oxoglutarate aldolase/2-dehydro-3-deoxy-phosphogluconate aldolase [Treponema sp.]|nr:bifunctional 4-hydroxy-2-oxoglutarate aldolase/2-dehydro-3-deoxy-phosphogluconate aldolase [Treponema sp.]MBQ7881320.1 bifunctional 4-hydroxy-2-oxoglutarate aldolase/2-dehydro-3-deoxy-phosphogluconate aldolase [Treponema sp.]
MADIYEQMRDIGIIPVVAIEDASKAADLAHALVKGGLPASEVTFRTACAEEAIKEMIKAEPNMIVGAGTVLNVEQAERAHKAGAKFIVSPGYNPDVVDYCIKNNIPTMPGISNPTEITACINKGLKYLKLFPAESKGGYKIIDDFGGPFPQISFMPTGGVKTENLSEYAKRKNILCMGGTWMVKKPLIEGEKWDEITQICKDAVKAMHGFYIDHVGINTKDDNDAMSVADTFELFGLKKKVGNSSIFSSDAIEVMKGAGRGTCGHLSVTCNNIERALAYLKQFGFSPVAGTEKWMGKEGASPLKVVYLDKEVGGFAIHLKRA